MKKSDFIKTNYKIKTTSPFLRFFTYNYFFVIVKSWIVQGFLDLSVEEKIYKIIFDIIGVSIVFYFTNLFFFQIVGIFLVHSVNWITNDHFMDNLCHLNILKTNNDKMFNDLILLKSIVNNNNRIVFVGVYGRIARGEKIHSGSDIDIRIIRKKGFINAIYFAFFGHFLRFYSLLKLIPIDLNIWNDISQLNKMRQDENPLILKIKMNEIVPFNISSNNITLPFRKLDVRHEGKG